jgi:signal transduction histidine kinase
VLGWAIGELEKLGRGAQDLMDVIGLEVGALRLEQEQVEVGELLEDVARAVAGLAGRKRQSVRVDVGQAARVLGDPGRLRQALANLVRNALQASGEGAAVDLRARVQEGEVIIEVQDYGTGIPKDELERVWEPFFRSAGRRREYPGHGLGLTVAKMIAEKHGGRIEVESELGRGSTFRLILPQLGGRPNAGQPQAEGTR